MTVDLVFITYNRLDYTKLAIDSLLADASEQFSLTIWDNASTDGTVEYLKNQLSDNRITDIVFSKENVGQAAVINQIWGRSKAELLGKVDNDCLVTPGWTRKLAQAHADIDQFGVVACWHFFPEDFDYELAKHKIQTFGRHRIFRHPWTGGTGFLLKRSIFEHLGPMETRATTSYWLKVASAGFINGFYYPLIYQEHMDDPRSKHNRLRSMPFDEAYQYTVGRQSWHMQNIDDYNRIQQSIIKELLTGPYDPKYYCGWRAKFRRLLERVRKTRLWASKK